MNSRIKDNVQKIFEFWSEVTNSGSAPFIREKFPENFNDKQILNDIPHFAFPCDFETKTVQTYSFVLTGTDSKWRFGFCRHEPNSQTAFVIITYLPWHDLFLKFLNILVELRKRDEEEFRGILKDVYAKGVPEPGACYKITYDNGMGVFSFQRPSQFQLPSIPENHNLNLYYNFVEPKNMIAIFASMLAERRIVFTSRRLDILSSCCQAANAFLYPMVWQHIFIPILPMKMKDFLLAPMPFLIGVPEAVLKTVRRDEIGDMVVLNCDNKCVETPFDDVKDMPAELVSQLKKNLSNQAEHRGDRVSRIFLRILVQLIGGYRDAVKFSQYAKGQKITWDRDAFVETRPPSLRPFLKKIMDLQIFQQFIEERLEMLNTGLGFSDEFELETLRDDPSKRGKNYKEFLRNVKDKTNPAMKTAVKSVREGGKGVKLAYKDLKSKLKPSKGEYHGEENNNSFQKVNENRRSVPNSPVFTKTKRSESLQYGNQYSKSQLQPSTSSTGMASSSYSEYGANGSAFSKTPSESTSSSSSVSDMNLLQEIQQLDLFRSPPVDRTLKSVKVTRDYSLRPPTTQAPVPIKRRQGLVASRTAGKSQFFDTVTEQTEPDTAPELPSPKVPPKKSQQQQQQLLNNSNLTKLVNLDPPNVFLCAKGTIPSSSSVSVPLPPPRLPPPQTLHDPQSKPLQVAPSSATIQKQDNDHDLIKLDTSIELEDFDPLNQNARQIPSEIKAPSNPMMLLSGTSAASGFGQPVMEHAPVVMGFNNPLYPYYTPHTLRTSTESGKSSQMAMTTPSPIGDETELLKKYGLDRFSLIEKPNNGTDANAATTSNGDVLVKSNNSNRTNWTTFD